MEEVSNYTVSSLSKFSVIGQVWIQNILLLEFVLKLSN